MNLGIHDAARHGLRPNWRDAHIKCHGGNSHLLHKESPVVSHKAQCWVPFCSFSIPALLVMSYPYFGFHTIAMPMTLNWTSGLSLDNSQISPSVTAQSPGWPWTTKCTSCVWLAQTVSSSTTSGGSGHFQPHEPLRCLFSPLSLCDWITALSSLPLYTIQPLQLIQNAAAQHVFNLSKFYHITPFLCSLHYFPVPARIILVTLMHAYKEKKGTVPTNLKAFIIICSTPQSLQSSSTDCLDPPSLRVQGRHASSLFFMLTMRWRN